MIETPSPMNTDSAVWLSCGAAETRLQGLPCALLTRQLPSRFLLCYAASLPSHLFFPGPCLYPPPPPPAAARLCCLPALNCSPAFCR